MQKFLNSSGSYWRKWDLHIHSPSSILNSEFGEDWGKYIQTLENLNDISVVGITDYYSIEGYKKVKQAQLDGRLTNLDLILPNVELRLDLSTNKNRPINIHVIFDPEVDHLIDRYFLEELEFPYDGISYKCTNSDLIHLGECFIKQPFSPEKALKEGMKQFKVSLEKLNDVCNKHNKRFKGKYIIVVPNSNHDGNSGLKDDAFQAIRREIYRSAHAIFSSNPRDRNFFLGEKNHKDTIEQCGKIMPCIHGSDAHSFEKIGNPDQNRFTWIKADPSFKGLLQILHEPKDRVIIQESHPDQKIDYNVIESIKFMDSVEFTDKEINLNPGLNTVIGGKSSGKSLLLYKIAQTISHQEIQIREKDELWKNPYKGTFIEDVKLKIKWRNGQCSTTNDTDNVGKVTYIPQMYINSLSEDTANDVLQQKVRDILLQNDESREFWESKRSEGTRLKNGLSTKIVNLFELFHKLNEFDIKSTTIGNSDSITKEIDKIQEQIDEKIKSANLTPEDEDAININEEERKQFNQCIIDKKNNTEKINQFSSNLKIIFESTDEKLTKLNGTDEDILEELKININQAFETAQEKITEKVQLSNEEIINLDKKVKQITRVLEPLLEKVKGVTEIQQLKERQGEQTSYIKQIQVIEEEKKEAYQSSIDVKDDIMQSVSKMFELKKDLVNHFNSKNYFKDIKIKASIIFDQIGFETRFLGLFARRAKLTKIFPGSDEHKIFNDEEQFIFDEKDYVDKIKHLLEMVLLQDEGKLRKGYSKQQAIEYLLDSYTKVIIDLERDGDTLSQMSPGKRGLVLLELFLDMSNEIHPILIDQPEDNLDNRTISTELVKFIKEKSPQRQIIIVTHNANLVVLADSDNVIVANQDAQLNENEVHRFEYITGALECDYIEIGKNKLSNRGIKSHVCEILEGGKEAFEIREKKYGF
ncbi:TrlF family AAA-like ATPase [Bacillus paramycoides]|uniref:TrlF family AAA-like ATPase n=1 Tax=Bacillus paramycoides TaxID=2026194 RepID=UPI0037F74EB9